MWASASDASAALALDLGALIGLIVVTYALDARRALDRAVFGLLTAILIGMYVAWRWSDTLPPFDDRIAAIWSYAFFTLEAVAITYTLMSIVILVRSKDRTAEADVAEAGLSRSGDWPAVDIFICTYNEPLDVVEKAIIPALAIDYERKTVWVLDDTRRPWLRDYCQSVGANYVTRPDNKGAKAGNLNNGLAHTAGLTNAPLILVLDADFAAQPNILRRMVGLFNAPDVGVVQSPQFFYNPDPIQHNLLAAQSWVDDQRIFFDVFQPAKDAWGCAFCVGTSFVVRRDCLNEIGGFPQAAICEDINLTYTLMAAGYRTHWLNERLSCGLAAEGLPEYITQRTRWCLGTIQVALLKSGPFFGRGFTLAQRLHYLHGLLNWLSKPFLAAMLIAPSIYWLADIPAFQADYVSFLRYGVPALLAFWIYSGWVSQRRTLPLFMEVTNAMTALAVTATLLSAAVRPFGRPFKVTDKGGEHSRTIVRWRMAATFGLISLLSALGILAAFVSPYAASEISDADYFNLVWAAVAMIFTFVAFLVCFERPREEQRFHIREAGVVRGGRTPLPCTVSEMSLSHALVQVNNPLEAAGRIGDMLVLPGFSPLRISAAVATAAGVEITLQPTAEQRRQLILKLYTQPGTQVAATASLRGALHGLLTRASNPV